MIFFFLEEQNEISIFFVDLQFKCIDKAIMKIALWSLFYEDKINFWPIFFWYTKNVNPVRRSPIC